MAKHKLHFDTYCSVSEVLNTAHERLCSFCGALFCKRSLVKTQAETGQRSTFDQLTASGFTNKIQESYSLMHKNLAFLFMSDYWIIVFLRLTVAFFGNVAVFFDRLASLGLQTHAAIKSDPRCCLFPTEIFGSSKMSHEKKNGPDTASMKSWLFKKGILTVFHGLS